MLKLDSHPSGRHFLQIPGPTNVPDRVLRAIDMPMPQVDVSNIPAAPLAPRRVNTVAAAPLPAKS